MPTIDRNQRLAVLVKQASSTTLHLIVGKSEGGMVSFACEQAPLMTLRGYGSVKRCPICQQENPIRAKKENE
jgi:hypothetical protein